MFGLFEFWFPIAGPCQCELNATDPRHCTQQRACCWIARAQLDSERNRFDKPALHPNHVWLSRHDDGLLRQAHRHRDRSADQEPSPSSGFDDHKQIGETAQTITQDRVEDHFVRSASVAQLPDPSHSRSCRRRQDHGDGVPTDGVPIPRHEPAFMAVVTHARPPSLFSMLSRWRAVS